MRENYFAHTKQASQNRLIGKCKSSKIQLFFHLIVDRSFELPVADNLLLLGFYLRRQSIVCCIRAHCQSNVCTIKSKSNNNRKLCAHVSIVGLIYIHKRASLSNKCTNSLSQRSFGWARVAEPPACLVLVFQADIRYVLVCLPVRYC